MSAREVRPADWGKAVLDEVLFRAGKQVGDEPASPSVEVRLDVRLTADGAADRIEIVLDSETDEPIVTYLPRPF